ELALIIGSALIISLAWGIAGSRGVRRRFLANAARQRLCFECGYPFGPMLDAFDDVDVDVDDDADDPINDRENEHSASGAELQSDGASGRHQVPADVTGRTEQNRDVHAAAADRSTSELIGDRGGDEGEYIQLRCPECGIDATIPLRGQG
ncbi:MAG: hypothetical protein ACOC0P_01280, partial [Planctomycetota bacterium]